MPSAIGSILRAATRREGEPLNILTAPTHEAYETCLALTGHNFYAVRSSAVKDWNKKYRPLPANYTLLNPAKGDQQLPVEIDFDLVLSQNRFGQYQMLATLAQQLHLPLVTIEHTLPVHNWSPAQMSALRSMTGDINCFISEYSRAAWGFDDAATVIHHGIDTDVFKPAPMLVKKEKHALSVCNDWINRDYFCGFKKWQQVVGQCVPTKVLGDTPGLSKPAASVAELVREYRKAQVFLNTSLISPVPTSLLEAMACGTAVVSTATCMIPDVIENGVNGFISNDVNELNMRVQTLLDNPGLAAQMGAAARQTILDKFSVRDFVANWNAVLRTAAAIPFTGTRR